MLTAHGYIAMLIEVLQRDKTNRVDEERARIRTDENYIRIGSHIYGGLDIPLTTTTAGNPEKPVM